MEMPSWWSWWGFLYGSLGYALTAATLAEMREQAAKRPRPFTIAQGIEEMHREAGSGVE